MADTSDAFLRSIFGSALGGPNAQDLLGFQQSLQQNSSLRAAAQPVLGAQFDTRTWSPGTTAGVTAAQAFLGGLLNNLAARDEAKQVEQVAKVLPSLYADPMNVLTPEGVDESAFANLKLNALSNKQATQTALAQLGAKQVIEARGAGMAEKAKIEGQNEAYGFTGGENPDSPGAKLRRQVKEDDDKSIKLIRDEEDAARKELSLNPAVVSFKNVNNSLAKLKAYKDENSKESDFPFTYAFVTGLDGGVVKEGEVATISGSNPIIQAYKKQIESAINGGSGLGVELKNRIYKELQQVQSSTYATAKSEAEKRLALVKERGGNPSAASPIDLSLKFGPAMSKQAFIVMAKNNGWDKATAKSEWLKMGGDE